MTNGPNSRYEQERAEAYTLKKKMQMIIDAGGTLLIGSGGDTQFFLPPDMPYPSGHHKSIRNTAACSKVVSELLTHTIGVADAAEALGKSEDAILKALKHGALGGIRLKGIWRVSKLAVEAARPKSTEADDGAD